MSGYQITVTQAMLDAGVEALHAFSTSDPDYHEQIVTDIFRAMLTKGEVVYLPVVEEENAHSG